MINEEVSKTSVDYDMAIFTINYNIMGDVTLSDAKTQILLLAKVDMAIINKNCDEVSLKFDINNIREQSYGYSLVMVCSCTLASLKKLYTTNAIQNGKLGNDIILQCSNKALDRVLISYSKDYIERTKKLYEEVYGKDVNSIEVLELYNEEISTKEEEKAIGLSSIFYTKYGKKFNLRIKVRVD